MARAEREWRIRLKDSIDQDIHRESWQDELEQRSNTIAVQATLIDSLFEQLEFRRTWNNFQEYQIQELQEKLAEKEAEITRLNVLLEGPRHRTSR